jgi:hypothetical protein
MQLIYGYDYGTGDQQQTAQKASKATEEEEIIQPR